MDINELEFALSQAQTDFNKEIDQFLKDSYDQSPATKGDLLEVARQVDIVLNTFRVQILSYLKQTP